ncbi:MAG TPA: squalene/phytoene synthase family protein [Candidatus Acidoferrum sp.]|nr:squalene/phytoene synthase family protein [Candidatus Acidoferrum sp.]
MLAPERFVETLGEGRSLADCYRYCGEIVRAHSQTFYLSSLFLNARKRRAVWAVYAFCRTADDIADRIAPAPARLAALDRWEQRLIASYRGDATDAIFVAYADAAQSFGIPIEPALDLLHGARMDVEVRRYETYEQLRRYCYLVASTVGLLVMPILGTTTSDAIPFGVELGRAMQMTNILRDVGEDARMDRIYLPAEDLERFGCREESILGGVCDERFFALMRFEIERVRTLYDKAVPGIALLAPESRYTVRLALTLYRRILDSIEANGYDVFARRAHVPLRTKALIALTAAFTVR